MASAQFSTIFFPFNYVGAVVQTEKVNTVEKNYSMTHKDQRAEGVPLVSNSVPLRKRYQKIQNAC